MNASTITFFYLLTLFSLITPVWLPAVNEHAVLHIPSKESPSHNGPVNPRSRKSHGPKKQKIRRTYIKDMPIDQLRATQAYAIEQGTTEFAIKCTEQLIKICTDINELANLLLCLADLYFEQGSFETAARLYGEFVAMYPGRPQLEYVSYRAILAQFYLTADAHHDQTNTQTTIALANQFLERSTIFTTYTKEVQDIRTQCLEKEAESELCICSFYINQGNFKAAHNRLNHVRDSFLKELPDLEAPLMALETTLSQKQKGTSGAPLSVDNADTSSTVVAHNNQVAPRLAKNRF